MSPLTTTPLKLATTVTVEKVAQAVRRLRAQNKYLAPSDGVPMVKEGKTRVLGWENGGGRFNPLNKNKCYAFL